LLPEMEREAVELAAIDLRAMKNEHLAREIERRQAIIDRWRTVYRDEFIPFAHGARLFGEVYNERVKPDDPFEFIALLTTEDMKSMQRNGLLHKTADMISSRMSVPTVEGVLKDPELETEIDRLLPTISGLTSSIRGSPEEKSKLTSLIVKMAQKRPVSREHSRKHRDDLERRFIEEFDAKECGYARELLDLGRKSYRLRDDDNLYLGRIESELERALRAGWEKLKLLCTSPAQRTRMKREPISNRGLSGLGSSGDNRQDKVSLGGRPGSFKTPVIFSPSRPAKYWYATP
jgi:hypothetical protein